MAHAAVDHLRMPGRRPISAAVVGGAEKGAALDYLAGNAHLGLCRVVAGLDGSTARIYAGISGPQQGAAASAGWRWLNQSVVHCRTFPTMSRRP